MVGTMWIKGLLAVATALVVLGVSVVATGALRSDAQPVQERVHAAVTERETPDGIAALLRAIEALVQELRQAILEGFEDERGTLTPRDNDEATESEAGDAEATSEEDEPCKTEHDSGPGWSRTEVRCHHEQVSEDGSISISSSSSSSTTTSSSD